MLAVLGNHDWWNDGERTRRAFQAQGIMVLEETRHLFVTAGVGTSIIPVRFLVPPEIALLTLR